MSRKVAVVDYQAQWSEEFEHERALVEVALGENCITVHHIGSTSVPGLASKPIIDMLPVVRDITQVDTCQSAMQALGYAAMGELGMPMRRFFRKGDEVRTHHVHVFQQDNAEIERHLKFRDWLRAHPEDRQSYAALKQQLAQQYPNDIQSYIAGKEALILSINQKAGWRGVRIVKAFTPRELAAVHHLRAQAHLPAVELAQDEDNSVHLVLYVNTEILGYAHVLFLSNQQAGIAALVIESAAQRHQHDAQLLGLLTAWLKSLGVTVLYAGEADGSPESLVSHGFKKSPPLEYDDCLFNLIKYIG